MQTLGAICGAGVGKGFQPSIYEVKPLRAEVPTSSPMVTPRDQALVLRLSALLSSSTLSFRLLMPREMPETLMSLWTRKSCSDIRPLSARKLSLTRAIFYIVMQTLGAICSAGVVKGFQPSRRLSEAVLMSAHGHTKGPGPGAEIIGTFSRHLHHHFGY